MNFYPNWIDFQMFKLVLDKAEKLEIKLPTFTGSSKKQKRVPEKHLFLLKTVENSERGGLPDHLTCLLRNLYAGREAAVRTGHETTDWFQTGKSASGLYIVTLFI